MPSTLKGDFRGSAQAFQDSLATQPWLILAALATVYIILGVLYESFRASAHDASGRCRPRASARFSLLWGMGQDFLIMALIGVVLLIGIVKKNGILMVDFARSTRQRDGV